MESSNMQYNFDRLKVIDFVEARNRVQLNRKRLEVDVGRYQSYLESDDISDEQKADFLKALWTVMVAFVDLGYGVHPVQAEGAEIINFRPPAPRGGNACADIGGTAHV